MKCSMIYWKASKKREKSAKEIANLPDKWLLVIKDPDVAAIRKKYGMTQQEFSILLGISIGTLRNWEQ